MKLTLLSIAANLTTLLAILCLYYVHSMLFTSAVLFVISRLICDMAEKERALGLQKAFAEMFKQKERNKNDDS